MCCLHAPWFFETFFRPTDLQNWEEADEFSAEWLDDAETEKKGTVLSFQLKKYKTLRYISIYMNTGEFD